MRHWVHQLRDLPPVAVDRLVTGAVLLVAIVSVLAQNATGAPRPVLALVAGAVIALSTLGRRDHPLAAVTVGMAAFLVDVVAGGALNQNSGTLVSLVVLAYSLGRHADARRVAMGLAVLVPAVAINAAYAHDGFVNDLAFNLLVSTGLPIVAGVVLRRRAALVTELQAQRGELERERDARIHDAAIAERVRIARELHDVVVHDVSEMVVQAAAARQIVRAQPHAAAAAIARVEGAGRGALDELRRALGLLRADDRAMALEPQPTLAGLYGLVDRSPVRIDLDVDGSLDQLPADLQLTAYRIVEDVLADGAGTFDHGAVRVTREETAVAIEIVHDGPPPAAVGLAATRQRVGIFDGELDISSDDRTGSRICARLPLQISASG